MQSKTSHTLPVVGAPTVASATTPSHSPQTGIALKAIAEFECIGSACEDTCCASWSVPLSADDISRFDRATKGDPEVRRIFDASIDRSADVASVSGTAGVLKMVDDGKCGFLDHEGWCSIHKAAGVEGLGTVCIQYPRRFASIGNRLEMTPQVSCPEAVRRLLFAPDGVEIVDLDPSQHTRIVSNHIVGADPTNPWERYMDDVRARVLELLWYDQVPLDVRSFWVAALAREVHPFFGKRQAQFDEARLATTLEQFGNEEYLGTLWDEFARIGPEYALGPSVAYQAMAPRAGGSAGLTSLFQAALATYGPPEGIEAAFLERAHAIDAVVGQRWDDYFGRLSINYWVQSYLDGISLLEHVRTLSVQLQALRFFVLGDPELEAVRTSGATDEALIEAFDRAVVRVVYRFARATEHAPGFQRSVNVSLDDNGVVTFGHLVRILPRNTWSKQEQAA